MKKILIILLALTLVFSLASCKKDEPAPDNTPAAPTVDLEAYKTAIANTSLAIANIKVTASNDIFPNDPLVAEYDVEFNDDGSAVVRFTYMQYNEIKPGVEQAEITSTFTQRRALKRAIPSDHSAQATVPFRKRAAALLSIPSSARTTTASTRMTPI